ncbi:hypothetical protein Tsubulata_033052 [Turnera subulata]|uniref:RRM domain-containing protein n=1 Tax=Turnera subulata TaxID=218843 RepID=A0A9Q0F1I4_9ROSI|nr:hypothetical protein Tsubulata_033052 [Turnera subulata]
MPHPIALNPTTHPQPEILPHSRLPAPQTHPHTLHRLSLPHPQTKHSYFSKWSRHQVQRAIGNIQVTSLYVENLPLEWLAIQAYQNLSRFGEIVDVFIPSKTNRFGKKFGFVCFRSGGDIQRILADLNCFHVGSSSLCANIARDRVQKPRPTPQPRTQAQGVNPGRSFAKALTGTDSAIVTPTSPLESPGITFSPTADTLSWLSRCAFDVLRMPADSQSVKSLLTLHGVTDVTVSQTGGDSILVCFDTSASMSQFCLKEHDWVQGCFLSLEPWKQRMAPSSRSCWIVVRGVPLQAWSQEFFSLVAMFVATFICLAEETENRSRLDYAKLQVVTSFKSPINQSLTVSIAGQSYNVSILESPPYCGPNNGTASPLVFELPSIHVSSEQQPTPQPNPANRAGCSSAVPPFTDDHAELEASPAAES